MKRIFMIFLLFFSLISSVQAFDPADSDLLALYKLDGDLTDTTGNQADATATGATSTSTGCPNGYANCYDFDGVNDYITATGFTSDNTAFTWGAWFKFGSSTSANSDLINKYSGGGKAMVHLSAEALKEIRTYCGGFNSADTPGTYAMGTELHIVAKVTTANRLEVYVNGTNVLNNSCTGSTNAIVWQMGQTVAGGNNYDGTMNEVFFINRSLTATEIADIFNNGFAQTETIQTNISSGYAYGNFSLNVSTVSGGNTNMSYILDGGGEVFFANNTNETTLNFNDISVGSHNISFKSNVSNNIEWTNYTFEVQPNQYFRFRNGVTGAFLESYTFGGVSSIGQYVTLNISNLNIGLNQLNFSKVGYVNQTFNVTFNNTAQLNETFNVSAVTLTMRMYNVQNTSEQLTFDVTILNGSTSQLFTSNLNFSKNYTEIPTGDLEFVVESTGYADAYFYNTITQYTSIEIIGYLIPINDSDVVTFTVQDKSNNLALENVTIEAQQLINGSYTTISQAQTEGNGQTFMYLDLTEAYKFIFTKDGYVQATATAIPSTTSYTVKLTPSTESFDFIDGVSYAFTPSSSLLYNDLNYTFQGFISGTSITNMIYRIYNQNGTSLYNQNSTNPTGTTFSFTFTNLNATLYTSLNQTITYTINGISKSVWKTYDVTTISNTSVINYLKYDVATDETEDTQILRWLVMVVSIGGSFLIGRAIGANTTGYSVLVISVVGFFAYIDWLPEIYAGAIATLAIIVALGGGLLK